jgi:hypothetical protein
MAVKSSLGSIRSTNLTQSNIFSSSSLAPRQLLIGVILILALFAFEMFNFDTTRYALENLLGDVRFAGLGWAAILAIAFCAIDFAGLARLFTPERGGNEPKEVWYLMGAWLLGATMNALMTWWAVSLTLLDHQLGNEVLSREQLIRIVPVFVAVLVWLTRVLFIGAVTVAGERMLDFRASNRSSAEPQAAMASKKTAGKAVAKSPARANRAGGPVKREPLNLSKSPRPTNNRVRQRPPRPGSNGIRRAPVGVRSRR